MSELELLSDHQQQQQPNNNDDENNPLLLFAAALTNSEDLAAHLVSHNDDTTIGTNTTKQLLLDTATSLFKNIEATAKQHGKLLVVGNNKKKQQQAPLEFSGLQQLIVEGDAETVWAQVELQTAALQRALKKSIQKLQGKKQTIQLLRVQDSESEGDDMDKEDADEQHRRVGSDNADNDTETEQPNDKSDESDEDAKRMRARMERTMASAEEEDDESEQEEEEDKQQRTINDPNETDPAAQELNDGFFDISEMEAFADEEEDYLPDAAYGESKPETSSGDMRTFHQRQRDGDAGSDDDNESVESTTLLFQTEPTVRRRKYRDDGDIDALYSLYDNPKNDDDDEEDDSGINATAADLFGKPQKHYFEQYKSRPQHKNDKNGNDNDDDDDSWNDYNFDQANKKQAEWGNEDNDDDDEDEAQMHSDDDEPVPMKGQEPNKRGGGQSKKLLEQTEQLEKELLAEKPWQMTGESTSTSRPVNSLLEGTPEFEVANKQTPIITVEHTADLEEVIKQRILNEDWDDVVPRELPDVAWNKKRGELPEVSQEKSKLGLGELYEREYLKKAVGYDVDAAEKETDEDKAKNEMKSLFANLCSKLDALSNYHFVPRPIADEADVRSVTTPAIAMEEVLPLHVSDARGFAPADIYGTKRGREGVLKGDSEMEQQDRKRLRNTKKTARRKVRKEKQADEKLLSRLQPGLGLNNPYEKRKMREELSVARAQGKVTDGQADMNDYGASGTFFKRLQEEAESSIHEKRNDGKNTNELRTTAKSSALKL